MTEKVNQSGKEKVIGIIAFENGRIETTIVLNNLNSYILAGVQFNPNMR